MSYYAPNYYLVPYLVAIDPYDLSLQELGKLCIPTHVTKADRNAHLGQTAA